MRTTVFAFLLFLFPIIAMGQTRPLIPSVKTIYYQLGDNKIQIKVYQYGESKDLFFINLHDDETTAVNGARKVLESSGGMLVRIENMRQRNMRFKMNGNYFNFDPNRIFSRVGIIQTLKNFGPITTRAIEELGKFAERITELLPPAPTCIIALHNNSNGKFAITSYQPGQERERDAARILLKRSQDPDDLFLTTDSSFFAFLTTQKYNAVFQNNTTAYKDGSLSVYCGERNMRYLNCETEHGKLKQYGEMITTATRYLKQQIQQPLADIISYNYKLSYATDSIAAPALCDVFFGEKKIGTIRMKTGPANSKNISGLIQVAKSFPLYDNMDLFYYPAVASNPARVDLRIDPTRPKKLYDPAKTIIPVKVMH
ncbi:MAG: hypothetical protein ABI480_17550 [Chitinophagaceae bacterium]